MTAPVVDCSVTMAWVFGDESSALEESALDQVTAHGAVAPTLWWVEVGNVLLTAERRGRLTPEDTSLALAAIEALGIRLDHAPDGGALLRLAKGHQLTTYDAMYLELSIRQQRPLATLDHRLSTAAQAEGLELAFRNTGNL